MDTLRVIGPPLLALFTVLWIDGLTRRRNLLPPRFQVPPAGDSRAVLTALARRAIAMAVLWLVLWIGVFSPLGSLGIEQEIDFSLLSGLDLFALHLMLVICVVIWFVAGFVPAPSGADRWRTKWSVQLGLRTDSVIREVGIGLLAGVGAWLAVIGVLLAVALVIWWLGGEELLPQQPPPMIPWIAGLPILLRVGISMSAGFVEEMFFRGYLQPRVGLALSTALFVLAHASYEQPLMLLGVGLLSVIYGLLVRWRQNIWPAIAAHALFDAVQLLLVIPAALRVLPGEGEVARVLGILGLT
jgi:membrane protease YdiL (CAAX protease family)